MTSHYLLSALIAASIVFTQGCKSTKSSDASSETNGLFDKSGPRVDGAYCAVRKNSPTPLGDGPTRNGYGIFSAYAINLPGYLGYLAKASKVLSTYKGRAVMWGPNTLDVLEGSASGYFFMVLEFSSMYDFDRFYCADEYQPDVIKERFDATKVIYSVAKEGDESSIGVNSSSTKGNVKAFALFNDIVKDRSSYDTYLKAATELAKTFGGQRLVSGPNHIEIEGYAEDKPDNLTLFVFPSMKDLKAWYRSSEYEKLKQDRLAASKVNFVLAKDGLAP